jgi:crotonobetainyl-CoA:carnitine CoA-transferase CaiB-like acyl-CoA transferase
MIFLIRKEKLRMTVENKLPLQGILVLELGHTVMGPTTGLVLADMGAEVYKVERTGRGDDTRWLKGFGSGFFPFFNRNKKSISLDLKSDKGKEMLLKLIEKADVLIENFGPETVERLGVGYEVCRERNPRLIYCTLKGFMPGPYEKRLAMDEVVQMMGGLAYMTGPTGRPLRAGASITDILGGSFGVIGILAALYQRQFTGTGQLVQATLYESVAFLMGQHMAGKAASGKAPPPMPERERTYSVYDLFKTAEGEMVFIGVIADRHWERMCEVFGFTDWVGDPRLKANQGRMNEIEWLMPELRNRVAKMSRAEVLAMAEKASIPFAPVACPEDLFDDPHLNQSGSLATTLIPSGTVTKLPKIPLRMNNLPFDLRLNPPGIGEGSLELYKALGFSDAELKELANEGIVECSSNK